MSKDQLNNEKVELYLTEMQRNYLDISRQISETVLSEEDAERYSEFTRWTWAINQLSEDFYKPDKNGKYPIVDQISLDALKDTYRKALTECDNVLTSTEQNGIAGRMKEIAGKVKELLTKDSVALDSVTIDKDHPLTLDEIIERGRTLTVDLGEQQIVSKGGVLSSRIPIQVPDAPGGGLDGYFTASSTIHGTEDNKMFFRKYRQKYPELSEMFDGLEKTSYYDLIKEQLLNVSLEKAIKIGNDLKWTDDRDEMKEAATSYYYGALRNIFTEEQRNRFAKNPKFLQAISEFSTEYYKQNLTQNLYVGRSSKWLGTADGCNIDKRNAAMSAVSTLIGKKGLIAESQPMIAIINGVPTAGTFMTKAFDYNAYDRNPESPMQHANAEVYNNPAVFDDIAAIQAIDFICGNLDRHAGNLMMRFGEVDGKTMLTGITGIDNDLSFGLNVPDPKSDKILGNKFILPKNMGAIGEKTAQTIMSLQEDQLRLALRGYGLRNEEINAAWERTKILQNAIKEGKEYYTNHPTPAGTVAPGHLRTVPEKDWNKYSLDSLANEATDKAEMNQFATLKNMNKIVKEHNKREEKKDIYEQREIKAKDVLFGIKKQEAPKVEALEGKPIGTGIKYQIRKNDILGIDNPENIKLVIDENQKLSSKHGLSSTRIPLTFDDKDGKPVNGYFTAETFVNGKSQLKQLFEREIKKLSGEGGNPEWAEVMKRTQSYLREGGNTSYAPHNYDLKKLGFDAETAERLQKDRAFNSYYKNILSDAQTLPERLRCGYVLYGADQNGTIDKRNVAMSKMAELLGSPDVLAQSTTMQVQVGDKITNGIFMKQAPGIDYSSIKPGDPEAKITPAGFDGSPALKNIADIQILDYICMNVDRNESNLFYQFSPDGTKCLGVTGIDNDLSFGTIKLAPDKNYNQLPPLDSVKVVSEQMADKIKNMSANALIHTLEGQGLNQKEIYAAVDRFTAVQERIKNGQIKTVADEEWNNMKLSDLAAEKQSLFGRVETTFTTTLPSLLRSTKPGEKRDEVIFTKGLQVEEFSKKAIEETAFAKAVEEKEEKLLDDLQQSFAAEKAITSMTDEQLMKYASGFAKACKDGISSCTSIFHGESAFFTNLSDQSKTFSEYTKQLNNKLKKGTALSAEDISGLISGINSLSNAAGNYTSHVNDQDHPSKTQQKRKAFSTKLSEAAVKMRSLVQNTVDKREVAAKPEETLHRLLKNRQDYLQNHPEISDDQFKTQVATMIYLTSVNKNAVNLVKKKKMFNALMNSTVEANIEKIKAEPAFEKMLQENSKEQIINFAKEGTGNQLLNAYLKSQVRLDQQAAVQNHKKAPAPKKEPLENGMKKQ